jgi:hypothetical protein
MRTVRGFEDFVVHNQARLAGYGYCVTGDWRDADEAARQCLLLMLHRGLDRPAAEIEIEMWKTMRALAVLCLRRPHGLLPDRGPRELARGLWPGGLPRGFMSLPLRQREVFYLVHAQSLSNVEVSAILGIQPASVAAHLARVQRLQAAHTGTGTTNDDAGRETE